VPFILGLVMPSIFLSVSPCLLRLESNTLRHCTCEYLREKQSQEMRKWCSNSRGSR